MTAFEFYDRAKHEVVSLGYSKEINWQTSQHPDNIDERTFLQESAWVIYCSGFKESTVRKYFDHISLCFCDWESASEIARNRDICTKAAMCVFKNKRKHCAVAEVATRISKCKFSIYKEKLLEDPICTLQELPFIGKITSYHLAKNLGFDIAKPDRHLLRLSKLYGYLNVQTLCSDVSSYSGDAIKVVDIILWRYMERNPFSRQFDH